MLLLVHLGDGLDSSVVFSGGNDILLVLVSESWADVVWHTLENSVPSNTENTDNKTDDPLSTVKTILMDLKSPSSELDNEELSENNDDPDNHEHSIGEDSIEDVELVIDLSSAKHVKDLHQHKQVENDCQVARWGVPFEVSVDGSTVETLHHSTDDVFSGPILSNLWVWMAFLKLQGESNFLIVPWLSYSKFWDEKWSSEHECEKDNSLEDRHSKNVLHHLLGDDVFLLSVWWSLEEVILWKLGGKSQRGKRVHDQVDPQKLDSLKWRFPHNDGSDERSDESNNVDSKLELKESSDVIIDVSSPLASLHNRCEVIILNDNIRGRVSNLVSFS